MRQERNRDSERENLSTETVQGAALSLECVDDIERGDGLSLSVFGVGDCVSDDAFEERLQHTSGLFVDHCFEYISLTPSNLMCLLSTRRRTRMSREKR